MSKKLLFTLMGVLTLLTLLTLALPVAPARAAVGFLDPSTLTKWVDPLVIPPAMAPKSANYYEIGAYQIQQAVLPGNYLNPDTGTYPNTTVWGYGASQATANYPAFTIEATQGVPIKVKWTNNLDGVVHPLAVDTALDNAYTTAGLDPLTDPVPLVTHLHGGEVESNSDGGPNSYFTPGFAIKGPSWAQEVYNYPNSQPPATIWYHDHAMGITRLNVYMGLAGFYLIRNPAVEPANLPGPAPKLGDPAGMKYREIPLAIQDRMFNTDGSLYFPTSDINGHPYWAPEFVGDTIVVNGKVWPHLDVDQAKYRFRLLDGSNARSYNLYLSDNASFNPAETPIADMIQIGSDGGYLPAPVTMSKLLMMPGERTDVVIDFSAFAPGTDVYLKNDAEAFGDPVNANTSLILKFHVTGAPGTPDTSTIPATLNTISPLGDPKVTTQRVLFEKLDPLGNPEGIFLDGQPYMNAVDVLPEYGTTELWQFVNTTMDAHPMHLHLVQFQLVNREEYDADGYLAAWNAANPGGLPVIGAPVKVDVTPFLTGIIHPPDPNEVGWKDTIRAEPGMVTRIKVRFAPYEIPAVTTFPFDPRAGVGYVWHCHIIDHEDNEMMRPYQVVTKTIVTADNQTALSGVSAEFTASFADSTNASNPDTHTAIIDWGDGTTSAGVVTEANGAGTVKGIHNYVGNAADKYEAKVTVIEKTWGGIGMGSFTVTILPSNDATLNNLSISSGTLTPAFASGTTSYTDSVANSVSTVTVTPTVNESHAIVTVNGQAVTSGSPSQSINLNVGDNTISIVVTAQDTITTKTYTVTVTRVDKVRSFTSAISLVNPSVYGQRVTFVALVLPGASGFGMPTGTVTFKDGGVTIGTRTLNAWGLATYSTTSLSVGRHSITAVYGGDSSFNGSTSSALSQKVNKASTTKVISSANPSVSGRSVTFTATVSANEPGSGTPTGTVTFKDGGKVLGTATLDASGKASYSTSSLSVGAHSITAVYSGGGNYSGSTSPVLSQNVKRR